MADDKKIKLTKDEEKALAEGLKESAQLLDQAEQFDRDYKALSKKHPLKTKTSKYQD